MTLILIIIGWLTASLMIGFVLNRFVLSKINSKLRKTFALAISHAVFYAPSLVDIGHGILVPFPLLMALENSLHEFGTELNIFIFLLPGIVFIFSLFVSWKKLKQRST